MNGTCDKCIKPLRRVLFGGSFDPPTRAHIRMAKDLSARFDEVIVLPAAVSPFKSGVSAAPGAIRAGWLKSALDDCKNITVSDFEYAQDCVSYSYVTAQHFAGEGIDLYFAVGSDAPARLSEWARPDVLQKTVTFYVVPRPGFLVEQALLDELRAEFRIELADFSGEAGSSSLFRLRFAFGDGASVSTLSITREAERLGLYGDYVPITSAYPRFSLSPKRVAHIRRTAECALTLAARFGVDVSQAVRAALLHDIGKYTAPETVAGGETLTAILELPAPCRHASVSAILAREVLGETDEAVLTAVERHTAGDPDMTALDEVLFVADYIEPGRDFKGLAVIRRAAKNDLKRAVYLIYKSTVDYLTRQKQPIHPKTFDAYAHYALLFE